MHCGPYHNQVSYYSTYSTPEVCTDNMQAQKGMYHASSCGNSASIHPSIKATVLGSFPKFANCLVVPLSFFIRTFSTYCSCPWFSQSAHYLGKLRKTNSTTAMNQMNDCGWCSMQVISHDVYGAARNNDNLMLLLPTGL